MVTRVYSTGWASPMPASSPPVQTPATNEGAASALSYATSSAASASAAISQLSSLIGSLGDLPDITTDIAEVDKILVPITLPASVSKPAGSDYNLQSLPVGPEVDDVEAPVLPDAPEFTAEKPVLSYPAVPSALDAVVPASPELEAVVMPAAPDLAIPAEPSLLNIDIPAPPVLDIPSFDYTPPAAPESPNLSEFSFAEPEYVSSLLDAIKAKLLEWVNGAATGLSEAVETALFNRGRSREDMAALREQEEIKRNFASTGFPIPPGAMQSALKESARQAADKTSSINRDIAIKMAELEQQNRQFAMERAVALEGETLQYASGVATRALEAARISVTTSIELYNAIVSRYQAELESFKILALVFDTKIKAALANLDVYRGELEAAKLTGELNVQAVEIYRARIGALATIIEKYKAELQGAEITSNINRNIIGRFGEEVRAYGAQVEAKAKEYDAYATGVRAEVEKINVYSAEADAYRSTIGGYESLINARTSEKELEFKIKQLNPIAIYQARTEALGVLSRAEADRVNSLASFYASDVQKYVAEVSAAVQQGTFDIEEYRVKGQVLVERARTAIQALQANAQVQVAAAGVSGDIAKAAGSIGAQLAASAFSSVNYSQSTSYSASNNSSWAESASTNNSVSNSSSGSTSVIYSYTDDLDEA